MKNALVVAGMLLASCAAGQVERGEPVRPELFVDNMRLEVKAEDLWLVVSLKNGGLAAAPAMDRALSLGFFALNDFEHGTEVQEGTFNWSPATPEIAAKASVELRLKVNGVPDVYRSQVDPDREIAESDEENNEQEWSVASSAS
jgi:hypothetical protein